MRGGAAVLGLLFAGVAAAGDLPPLLDDPAPVRVSKATERRDPDPPRRGPKVSRASDGIRLASADIDADEKPARRSADDLDLLDFHDHRSKLGRDRKERASGKFGDRIKDLFSGDKKDWLFSDHAFDNLATPVSNPFLFEDPRALTEIRPIFMYQKVPDGQPNFRGGSLWFLGTRASVAFSEWFSLTLNKFGGVSVNPGGKSNIDSDFGLAEIWLGPKFTFLRNPQAGSVWAAGAIFQIPTGSRKAFQDTGSLSVAPYVSYARNLFEFRSAGCVNGILNAGYSFSTNRDRSDYFYANAHLDWDVLNKQRFYPVAELNYFQYTTDGKGRPFPGEGRDLINFGGQAKGAGLLTGALGARFKIIEAAQLGATFELPLAGPRDLFRYRFTVDLVFRY